MNEEQFEELIGRFDELHAAIQRLNNNTVSLAKLIAGLNTAVVQLDSTIATKR